MTEEEKRKIDANLARIGGKTWSEVCEDFENEMAALRGEGRDPRQDRRPRRDHGKA